MEQANVITKDKLVSDLKLVMSDAQELLRDTAGQAGGKVRAARARLNSDMDNAGQRLAKLGKAAGEQARCAARATEGLVHNHAWKAMGIGAALGVIIGMLIVRPRGAAQGKNEPSGSSPPLL